MIPADDVMQRIRRAIPDAAVRVSDLTGTSDHFRVEVTSAAFGGLGSLQRHRLVHAALKDVLGGPLHAIELVTRAPGEEGA